MSANNIILGKGIFAINGVDIALSRGGGSFKIEREYRQIEADGDKGPVKDRIVLEKSVAKLTMNILEVLPANLPKFYPALQIVSDATKETVMAKNDISSSDYQDIVTWTGVTKGGKAVKITLKNAINIDGFEWQMADKDDVVPEVVYTATYTDEDRQTEPWEIEFAK